MEIKIPSTELLLQELIEGQRKKVLDCARNFVPHATLEDVMQPNDFEELEENPVFRYEEGILDGMQVVQAAIRAELE